MSREKWRKRAEEFAEKLIEAGGGKLKRVGEEVRGNCPLPDHADKNASFGYNVEKDAYACSCSKGKGSALREALGYVKAHDPMAPTSKIVATYDYHDKRGRVLFQVCRLYPKSFFQRRPDRKGGWINGLGKVKTTIYRLPEILKGESLVVITEGEKDADNAVKLGYNATCSPMGAGKWRDRYKEFFGGKQCALIPDNDDPGRSHMYQVAASLCGVASEVKIVTLPGGEKSDLSDWIAAGGTYDDLGKMIEQAVPFDQWEEKPKIEEKIAKKEEKPATPDRDDLPGFDDGEWRPRLMANYLQGRDSYLATPIGDDGKGNNLYVYRDGAYRRKGEYYVRSEINDILGPYSRNVRISEALDLLMEGVKIFYHRINPVARTLINVKNGMLDWNEGKLREHDPKYLSTIQINAVYDPDATCEDLDNFLKFILPEDAISLVEEFIGYMMIPNTGFEKCLVAVGPGGNGKGTLLRIVRMFLGEENVSTLSIHEICEDRFMLGKIFGKLANICYDLESNFLERSGRFKQVVSGDTITADAKHKSPFEFTPFARLMFSCNEFPKSRDRSVAFWDRLLFVPFERRIRGTTNCIPNYEHRIQDPEIFRSALLNRALAGLRRLMGRGYFDPGESHRKMMAEHQANNDSGVSFINDCCTFEDPTAFTTRRELYQQYKLSCEDNGLRPFSQKEFLKTVKSFNCEELKRNGVRGFVGISVNNNHESSQEEFNNFTTDKGADNASMF